MYCFHYLPALLSICQNLMELKVDGPQQCFHVCEPAMHASNNASFCEIPVRAGGKFGHDLKTLVSPEDYDRLIRIAPVWSVSSNGYVVVSKREEGRSKTKYLHKIVMNGCPARHINGDRLDNRRSNLLHLQWKPKSSIPEQFDAADVPNDEIVENAEVAYDDGKKRYFGRLEQGRPEGFGILEEPFKTSIGWWKRGAYVKGMLLFYDTECPARLHDDACVPYGQRQVSSACLIGDHEHS